MEDSFRVRIDKTFGSLSSSSSSQTLTSSLWSLTDDEIQNRQRPREPNASVPAADDDEISAADTDGFPPSNADNFFFSANASNQNPNPNVLEFGKKIKEDVNNGDELSRCDDDEEDVRNLIGKDCTLDFEAEEDEYDKVAVGIEKIGHRLYMSDVTDYTSHVSSYNQIPETFKDASRDPRANLLAAKLRLKEDAETAKSFNSLHVSDKTEDDVSDQTEDDVSDQTEDVSGAQNNAPEDENLPKSILKRKDDQTDSKTGKRVRFESICKIDDHCTSEDDISEAINVDYASFKETPSQQLDSSLVPDYVRHPLRYTHYTFDSSNDMNEQCNRQAYMDFLNMVKKSKSEPDEAPADLTKPVIFNPKKKGGDASMITSNKTDHVMEEPIQKKPFPLIIAAGNTEENEASGMEVDEQETTVLKVGNGKRTSRKYRSKLTVESNDPDTGCMG